jgi:hypothetical protein
MKYIFLMFILLTGVAFASEITLNQVGYQNAVKLIRSGNVSYDNWVWDPEIENEILGDDKNWEEFSKYFLGIRTEAKPDTKNYYAYPIIRDGKVYKKALDSAKRFATKNNHVEILDALEDLYYFIDYHANYDNTQYDELVISDDAYKLAQSLIDKRAVTANPVRITYSIPENNYLGMITHKNKEIEYFYPVFWEKTLNRDLLYIAWGDAYISGHTDMERILYALLNKVDAIIYDYTNNFSDIILNKNCYEYAMELTTTQQATYDYIEFDAYLKDLSKITNWAEFSKYYIGLRKEGSPTNRYKYVYPIIIDGKISLPAMDRARAYATVQKQGTIVEAINEIWNLLDEFSY